jgi:hypothetical protein
MRLMLALAAFGALLWPAAQAEPVPVTELYTTQAVVTGFDERNRPLGFRLCFNDVLVKASGDASIVDDRRFAAFEARAGEYIDSFSYRDTLFGKPIHDEQGSYDRPHFLTCHFNPQKINEILTSMGRKHWPNPRPALAMVLVVHGVVHGRKVTGVLSSDGAFDADMRYALAAAARRYGVIVNLPSVAALKDNGIDPGLAAAIPATDFRSSPRHLTALWRWPATCNGAMPSMAGLPIGRSRRAAGISSGPCGASISTRLSGSPCAAQAGRCQATANPKNDGTGTWTPVLGSSAHFCCRGWNRPRVTEGPGFISRVPMTAAAPIAGHADAPVTSRPGCCKARPRFQPSQRRPASRSGRGIRLPCIGS